DRGGGRAADRPTVQPGPVRGADDPAHGRPFRGPPRGDGGRAVPSRDGAPPAARSGAPAVALRVVRYGVSLRRPVVLRARADRRAGEDRPGDRGSLVRLRKPDLL